MYNLDSLAIKNACGFNHEVKRRENWELCYGLVIL